MVDKFLKGILYWDFEKEFYEVILKETLSRNFIKGRIWKGQVYSWIFFTFTPSINKTAVRLHFTWFLKFCHKTKFEHTFRFFLFPIYPINLKSSFFTINFNVHGHHCCVYPLYFNSFYRKNECFFYISIAKFNAFYIMKQNWRIF